MLVRIYTGADGQSHFEETDLVPPDIEATKPEMVKGVNFRRFPAGGFYDWHTAPRRQYVITLRGEVEIQIGDGSTRRFGPGDIFIAEDVTGQGHTTRIVSSEPRITATVPLAD